MSGTTYRHVAIWIDHDQAVLLMFKTSPLLRPTVEGSDGQWFQYRIDASQHRRAQGYYEAVLSLLEPQDEIFILGPDHAKRELLERIEGHQGAKGTVVGLHDAAGLTDVDVVCPTGEVWGAGDGPRTAALIPKPASRFPAGLGRVP